MNHRAGKRIDDAAGDFVNDMSDAALDLFQNERGIYVLASLALSGVLSKASLARAGGATEPGGDFCRKMTVH